MSSSNNNEHNHANGNHKRAKTASLPSLQLSEEAALQRLVRFLQFETVSSLAPSSGAYTECAAWLVEQLQTLVPCFKGDNKNNRVFLLPEAPDHSPVVVAVWQGRDPSLPILLLNSHYDVVPAAADDWTEAPPFAGLRKNSRVYGRGAQDMKCVCLQYIEALAQIQQQRGPDWKPERSIYLTFVPDEEIGGAGMAAFLESETYRSLPGIALALDEGLASTTNTYSVFYGERCPWWVNVEATGPTGHGSRFIEHTAVEQLVELANKALAFREGQRQQLFGKSSENKHENCAHAVARKTLGDVTSMNITKLEAGVKVGGQYALNCVPPTAHLALDIRISPHVPPSQIGALLDTWCQECSKSNEHKVSWSYALGENGGNDMQQHHITSTDTTQNPWYAVFCEQMNDMGLDMEPQVFPAATDSRFLRALGIRALGFSPMRNTEILLHENNEYIEEALYMEGIAVYVGLITKLASQGKDMEAKEAALKKKVPEGGGSNGNAK